MKNFILLIVLFPFIISCSNDVDKQKEVDNFNKKYEDSVRNDSVLLALKHKGTENVAYDKINFGISKNEFEKKFEDYQYKSQVIAGDWYTIQPSYDYDDKLFLISIEGFKESANYIDNKLHNNLNNFIQVLSEKYGEPQLTRSIDFIKFRPGVLQWQATWNIGDKTIVSGIIEVQSGSEYKVVIKIYKNSMLEAVTNENSKRSSVIDKTESTKF